MNKLEKIARALVSLDFQDLTYDMLTVEAKHDYKSEAVNFIFALENQGLSITPINLQQVQ